MRNVKRSEYQLDAEKEKVKVLQKRTRNVIGIFRRYLTSSS
ncbi:hypothetical protein CEAHHEIO_00140 [Monkeypox virus]|uniref:Uncharacterized protein n=1 Tax=Monkeypox virus TaxID=10244 RepID=A0A650BV24_MONPV|nr:hypothetical protein PDLMKLCO_00139 [Monkeypox virus]URK21196.1 hypothetical protein MPXV-SI-2022V502225_00140 [Monkeypox virus]URK21387.1 hypothetical protein MPXV-SI-2022V52144_00140 [Monkeypox virus]URZ86223.1 hypothetical protein CEAHHEIO_00140 [Monkeypox virus]USE04193.1 hypothetical protein MPXV_SI2022_S3_00140 [Monkeypox virus]